MACLAMPDLKIDHRWEGWLSDTNGIAFDSEYRRYARHARDGTISVRDLKTDRELTRIAGAPPSGLDRRVHLRFSPRDRYLSVYHRDRDANRSLDVWEIAGGSVIRLRLADAAAQCEFDPEEQLAWVAVGDGSLLCYDIPSGTVAKRLAPGIIPYQIALRPGGKMLAVSGNETPVMEIRDTVSGKVVKTLEHNSGVESIAWSPDGQTLAVSCLDTKIHRFWAENWQSQPTLDGHQWAAASIAFSHSGDLLVSLGFDRVLKLWDPVRGKCLLSLNNPNIAGFSRDDTLIGATAKESESCTDMSAGASRQLSRATGAR
jgi:WD40 repeat protein